jgi:large subunit ribosomal protein L3
MKFIIGTKSEMTQVWKDGKLISATRIKTGPCTVVQVKNKEKDGYCAIQLGYGEKKEKNTSKPQKGHLKGLSNLRHLREFRIESAGDIGRGDLVEVATFEPGDKVVVSGVTKGKGFQGVVRRYGFSGSKKTHGNKDQLRMPGSIGAAGPAHVFKGTKMAGRMGGDNFTVSNLEIIEVDSEKGEILVKGAVPGAREGLILIRTQGELKIRKAEAQKEKEQKNEDVAENQAEKKEEPSETKDEKKENEDIEKVVEEADQKKKEEEAKKEEPKE